MRMAMLVHFMDMHAWDTAVILDKGNLPHLRCLLFVAHQGTIVSNQGHHRWGRFPLSKMTAVSQTCISIKCTNIVILIAARS